MGLVQFALHGNYQRFYQELKKIGKEINKNPIILFCDAGISTLLFGSGLSDYLNYRFYNKNFKQRSEYATIGYQAKFYKKTARDLRQVFCNKINFQNRFKAYTQRDFYYPDLGEKTLEEFLKKHKKFIVKPVNGLGGTDVRVEESKNIKNVRRFRDQLFKKELFLEEFIIQNKTWSKLCPTSVNTIRVMTSIVDGNAKIFFAAARVGNGSSVADNFHQGGMGVLVDCDKGILVGKAIDKELNEYVVHPKTGVKFNGFKIPYWEDIVSMCLEASSVEESVHVIGWDVAITDQGPIIIEGNNGPGFDLVQVLEQHGTKYMLEDIKKELKEKKKW